MAAPLQIVAIRWLDAYTTENDELSEEDIPGTLHLPFAFESCGYLVKSDKVGVSFCTDVGVNQDGSACYRGATFVPRGMVVSERVFPAPKRSRK